MSNGYMSRRSFEAKWEELHRNQYKAVYRDRRVEEDIRVILADAETEAVLPRELVREIRNRYEWEYLAKPWEYMLAPSRADGEYSNLTVEEIVAMLNGMLDNEKPKTEEVEKD